MLRRFLLVSALAAGVVGGAVATAPAVHAAVPMVTCWFNNSCSFPVTYTVSGQSLTLPPSMVGARRIMPVGSVFSLSFDNHVGSTTWYTLPYWANVTFYEVGDGSINAQF